MTRSRAMLLGALLVALPCLTIQAADRDMSSGITTATLANGMKVIIWPDHDIPSVAMQIWFRAGSRNESPGITGLSHFFEHMMFNGAKKYGPGEFDRTMEASGGSNNAETTQDTTVYQDWFPRTALELIFDLEADRMRDLAFDPATIESERGVVYSERRVSVDNSNPGLLSEQVQATAFVAHPYQFPVIGWPSDIESWTRDDLVRYFRTYYAPDNATLVVVGDVSPAAVLALARKYFEPIASQPPPAPVRTKEPPQLGERRVSITRAAQVPLLQMAWHAPAANDPDAEALDLLVAILAHGDSSRLHQRLVEKDQVALDVSASVDEGFDPGLAWLYVTLATGADHSRVEAIIDEEIDRIVNEGVTNAELRKAKNIHEAGFWRGMKTIDGKAAALGAFEMFHGGWASLFSEPERYEAVTPDSVRCVAAAVLRRTNRTVGVLEPSGEPAAREGQEDGQ